MLHLMQSLALTMHASGRTWSKSAGLVAALEVQVQSECRHSAALRVQVQRAQNNGQAKNALSPGCRSVGGCRSTVGALSEHCRIVPELEIWYIGHSPAPQDICTVASGPDTGRDLSQRLHSVLHEGSHAALRVRVQVSGCT